MIASSSLIQIICKRIYLTPLIKTKTGTTTPGQNGSASNGNERILYALQMSETGALPSDVV